MPDPKSSIDNFRLPGGSDRTVIIGMTGSGKTIFAGWLLSKQRFNERPWVWIDFKNETLLDQIGDPPLRPLKLNSLPGKRGLYRLSVQPWQKDELANWFYKVWRHENIGLVCDELSLIGYMESFEAVLRQGRSKLIPVIGCTQRPVDCDREIFTESQFMALFGIKDIRDYKTIQGMTGSLDLTQRLPKFWCYWYDQPENRISVLRPVSNPSKVALDLKEKAPYSFFLGS